MATPTCLLNCFLIPASAVVGAVEPLAHAASHAEGGSDELAVESLGTLDLTVTEALMPDGLGGLVFGNPAPAAHAASHSDGGSDEITVENLATASVDTTQVLKPDGLGGLVFAADSSGAIQYDAVFTDSLVSTNATVGAANSISIGENADVDAVGAVLIGGGTLGFSFIDTNGLQSVGIGLNSRIASLYSVAVGAYSQVHAGKANSTIVGRGANTYAAGAGNGFTVAVGGAARGGYRTVAVGQASDGKDGQNNVIIGARALTTVNGIDNVVVIGENASSTADRANVIGQGITSAGADSFRLGVSNTQHFTFHSWTPAAGALAVTHSLPVQINGNVYNLLLNQ